MNYTCINIQGNLISEDVLKKIEQGEASGQTASDFGIDSAANLRNEMEYAWSRIKLDWKYFTGKSGNLPANDPYGTTTTRRWMTGFFDALGFILVPRKSALTGGNDQSYAISHVAGNIDDLPVHIVGFHDPSNPDKNTIDIRSSGGTSRLSPHATVQEYLNVTEHLYGIAANGNLLRLMRDSGRLVKLTYLEFDLRRMLEEDKYSEFTLLFRLLHASRFPRNQQETESCLLERYYNESIESGNRIRDGLSTAVQKSLLALGNGFLSDEANEKLREKLRDGQLNPVDYYRQLRRLVYRLLFLMVAEERDLVYDPAERNNEILKKKKIYFDYYSISRLRKLSRNRYLFEARYNDIWLGLLRTFTLFSEEARGRHLAIEPLGGDLFDQRAIEDLESCLIGNHLLLECIRDLNEFTDVNGNLVSVNYRSLDVEEFGSVYEGLLDLHPVIEGMALPGLNMIRFTFHEGTDRKTTASYYTRPDLVNEIMKSAVIPVVEERMKRYTTANDRAVAILGLKVCDPAAGSGHFLLATARTLAWYHARVTSGEENPAPVVFRASLRQVIQHCIYGVDLNPDAVELCKLALWIESHDSGKPLSFLDHKIRCGNSLVGVTDLTILQKGIPDEAFDPVTGDDKMVARTLKRDNGRFRSFLSGRSDTAFQQQLDFGDVPFSHKYGTSMREVDQISQDSLDAVHRVRQRFEKMRSDREWFRDWQACNLWTAAFFYTYTPETGMAAPTSEHLHKYLNHPTAVPGQVIGKADGLASKNRFFHWPLEFPEVFDPASGNSGFDVMVGNPPWERIKLQQQEFFAVRDRDIANARTAAERKKLIIDLPNSNPDLLTEFISASHEAESTSKFLRASSRFPLTARGDINTYTIFSELFYANLAHNGISGIIVPTGIATDSTTSLFFSTLMRNGNIKSLYDFVNEKMIFPDVLHNFHFSLLTITKENKKKNSDFSFNNQLIEHLNQGIRHFSINNEEIGIINPESETIPVFTSRLDSHLILKIHKENIILGKEDNFPKAWNADFFSLFHMTNDSALFLNSQLEGTLPLYEAKMFYQFDHRYGTYNSENDERFHMLPKTELLNYSDPAYRVKSSFYVNHTEVNNRIKDKWHYNWFLGFRAISSGQLGRTFTSSIIPFCGSGNSIIQVNLLNKSSIYSGLLLSVFNSIPFDYITRQKASGANLNLFKVRQLPLPSPKDFDNLINSIIPFVLELTYTSWDIKAFADDVWKEADDELKAAIRKQWEENKAATGGHEWNPPEWLDANSEGRIAYSKGEAANSDWRIANSDPLATDHSQLASNHSPQGNHSPLANLHSPTCPLPPFKWDEERRAILKAELDAIYASLYGLNRKQLRYILDPADLTPRELENILDPWEEVTNPLDPEGYAHRSTQSTFPGETFRVLKDKDIRQFGEYRTRRLVLEAWEMQNKS